ncbi:MAG: ribonuclease HII [Limisphaerales bacterium]
MDRFEWEKKLTGQGIATLIGIDEAGRGPLAGPVVAAAVHFPAIWYEKGLPDSLHAVHDSKQVGALRRQKLYKELTQHPQVRCRIAEVDAPIIDQINILKATHKAMSMTTENWEEPVPEHALVDGLPVKGLRCPHTALVKGDARSFSVAAASILAKVHRDHIMLQWDAMYPVYGFARHKGYATVEHRRAILEHGPCPIHRRTFLGKLLAPNQTTFTWDGSNS